MAIVTTSNEVPSALKEPFSSRTGKGQVRRAQTIALYAGQDVNVCLTVRYGGGMNRRVGIVASAQDMYREDEDDHGNEVFVLERTIVWFQESNNPLPIDWAEVREVVMEVGPGSEF